MARVAPSERFRAELDDVLEGVDREADPIEAIGRLGARLILQQALEEEVTEFLGRLRYERTADPVSHRNGYERRTVKTMSGAVCFERPRVRDAAALGFESKVLGKRVARTHALESLVICSFLRGLSVRDVEAALQETFEEQVVSKSTVARVCRDTAERYRQSAAALAARTGCAGGAGAYEAVDVRSRLNAWPTPLVWRSDRLGARHRARHEAASGPFSSCPRALPGGR